ncbi:ABC transporter permease [Gordonia hydrophobica]|uniref:ABC transporter permease subunit n=1 Tax=Gordonia hydrophobica TaxID=40516 RepID=A0ABZ2TZL7_9ACTN|nr:ABC transporter permease subunit [Gordonia hydrophobica]MBM7366281.1 ABC-type transport system involved in multi-copper enzyme maturation permease subunit [Gordonia hydrophobica]
MNLAAVTTVAGLEVRQRIRSTRWKWTLAILFLLISVLILGTLYLTVVIADQRYALWAEFLFDYTLGLILFLGLAAAPTMSATSINGDRRDATLALVQATPITSAELTLGKLLGSWLASLALIGVALPYLLWGLFTGPVSILAGVLGIVVTALLLGCYCGLGLGFSALTARPAASAMLTQATVLLLLVGLPIAFGMTVPLLYQDHEVRQARYVYNAGSVRQCDDAPRTKSVVHTERTWWLLLPNPLLVVSDAVASGVDHETIDSVRSAASVPALGQSLARSGPDLADLRCSQLDQSSDFQTIRDLSDRRDKRYIGHNWYLGLLANLVLGALGVWVAVRRLHVPARRLPKGVRVA